MVQFFFWMSIYIVTSEEWFGSPIGVFESRAEAEAAIAEFQKEYDVGADLEIECVEFGWLLSRGELKRYEKK